jgi:hypothetical protein
MINFFTPQQQYQVKDLSEKIYQCNHFTQALIGLQAVNTSDWQLLMLKVLHLLSKD